MAIDPDLATVVDHDLVDVGVAHDLVDGVEAVQPGNRSFDHGRPVGERCQRCNPIELLGHHGEHVAGDSGGADADLVDEPIELVDGHAARLS